MKEQLIQLLEQYGGPIAAADAELIAAAFTVRTYGEGAVLFREGGIAREMFFVCDGVLRIAATGEAGNDVTFFFVREGAFCTILESFLHGTAARESILAACPVTLGAISREELEGLYRQLPWLRNLITSISQHMLMHKISLRNSYMSLPDSLSRYRLFLERQGDVALRVPLNSIASYLGITPQSLSRIRRQVR